MKKIVLSPFILSTLLFSSSETDKLFNMSLEELMQIEITTATGEKETASESISIVSVLTSTQLKQMGALNLYEAVSFLPGVQINETYMGYTVITFRGVVPGLYNNKALFMINGHPLHEKLFGSSHLEFLPLEMVDRVEVVRSPASGLYGTNAVSGVINVITKQGLDEDSEVTFRAGSYDNIYGSLSVHNSYLSMSASYQNEDGYKYGGTLDERGNPVSKDYQNDLGNLFIDFYGDDWRFNGAYYNSKKEKFGLNPIIEHGGLNNHEAFYFDFNKDFKFGSGTLKTWLRYDNMNRELESQKFPNPVTGNPIFVENEVERYSAEIRYDDKVSDDLSYIVGATYEHDRTDPLEFIDQTDNSIHPFSPFLQKYDTDVYALYAQVKYRFSEKLTSIAGFRVLDNSDTGSAFVPRLGLNYEYDTDKYIKFLYSEAYRSPIFVEKYAFVPGILFGDIDLQREKIQTFEVSLDSKLSSKSSLEATVYYLELEDEITRRQAAAGGSEYYNADGYYMYGLELAYNRILSEKSELMLNASYTDGKHNNAGDVKFIANYTANAMLTYNFNSRWSTTLSDQFVSSKNYVLNTGVTGSIDNYNLANITLTYKNYPFESNLYVKNIFDEEYTYPEQVRRNIAELPGGAGTTAYLTLRYYF